jgi:FixJ family two-component response regulator
MNSRVVMLVEDDAALLSGLSEVLRHSGLDVVGFQSFEAARGYLQRNRPGALVTDVRLGAFNGLHLVILAKQLSPDLTVFVYSGYSDASLQAEVARCGAFFAKKDDIFEVLIPALQSRLCQVH